jgi:DNA-binding beta-propeller fold protein YncE
MVTIVAVVLLTGLGIALVAGGIGLGTAVAVLPAATALSELEADLPQATTIPSFGGEGIGPGRFTDARSIGVDGDGRIYVGEYQGGRVQVFDAEGDFLTQWHADRDRPLRGLAVGRDGTVFLVQGGTIQRFQGETGEVLQPVDHPAGDGFDDVAMTADGGLVAFWYAAGQDNLVTFGRTGEVELTIPAAASGPAEESELDLRVASDGEGNLYGLGTFTQSVFVYSPQGRFLNRVGSSGDETGQLRAPSSIAVDDQGRIYVGDVDGVEVFHRDGRHLGTIDVEGFPFGLTFDAQGRLLVVNGTRVAWYSPLE